MAVTVTKDSGNTTFLLSITGLSTKLDPIIEKWAEYSYNAKYAQQFDEDGGLIPFDDITNQQKLNAINARVKALGLAEANAQENNDTAAAKEAEKTVHDLSGINGD